MADQILSQEEIDALLSAMDKGEVDLEGDHVKELEAAPYDLTSQNIMLRDQFEMLEEVYDRFVDLLRPSISSALRRDVEVSCDSTELVKYEEFLKNFSNPTHFNIFSMEPLVGLALIALVPDFVFFLIDCMLGGTGKSMSQVREFTLIEQRLIKKFVSSVLKNMEKAWGVACSIKTSLRKTETKPQFVHLVGATDLVIVTVFSINGEDFAGHLYLCIPYLMLEPIKDELSYKSMREVELESTHNPHLRNMLKETNVTISAELGKAIHTVGDLLNIQAGDVLKLNTGPQDRITVAVEEIPKYQGIPGVVKGNRAVQVTALLQQKGGATNHEPGR